MLGPPDGSKPREVLVGARRAGAPAVALLYETSPASRRSRVRPHEGGGAGNGWLPLRVWRAMKTTPVRLFLASSGRRADRRRSSTCLPRPCRTTPIRRHHRAGISGVRFAQQLLRPVPTDAQRTTLGAGHPVQRTDVPAAARPVLDALQRSRRRPRRGRRRLGSGSTFRARMPNR